ncbi:hypothetical protein [Bacillus cereus]|uniref:hypothetical protein n=1 Tax=Bacillus cereus TaxID=1396 RepID=UPI000BF4B8D0|nr:hypothetical protein [Bacillus cereus]PEV05313.1 hypothetical protein CN407_21595 [Bacillus cereus]PGM65301.1 hypothetical protein CN950_16895 [Bacillus cereus]HDR8452406.1 hypothetical protein [Bacillus cereus]HDR8460390.1 hypothetical protein [Bacillus cereus]
MSKSYAIITFSNNEELIVYEEDLFIPVKLVDYEGTPSSAMGEPYKIWSDHHDGFIPCLTELIASVPFFKHIDDSNKIYKSSAVVKITNP